MKVTLKDILPQAANSDYAVAGFNVFDIEWARAVIRAAESAKKPVIIMANRAMISHFSAEFCAPIFSSLAECATVPVCVHLDHNTDYRVIEECITSGFSSVMFDGAAYTLEENISHTNAIVKIAAKRGVSVEGEVGSVRYTDMAGTETVYTEPKIAQEFVEQTRVDALAISVGTTHRMEQRGAEIQYERIKEIEERIATPLVIHGTSGIEEEDIIKMKKTSIAKFNIGTILRQKYAHKLRETLEKNPRLFDPYEIRKEPYEAVEQIALKMLELVG